MGEKRIGRITCRGGPGARPKVAGRHKVCPYVLSAITIAFLIPLHTLFAFPNQNKIKIVATTTTLASLAWEIAGGRGEIHAIASPRQNIHFYQPTPKDVVKVKRADVLIHSGFDLELWRDPLLVAAGNSKFLPLTLPSPTEGERAKGEGAVGSSSIDASHGIDPLEVPSTLSRSEGDIHRFGNPHYWMDPENAKQPVRNIAEGLSRLFPDSREEFQKNADDLVQRIDAKIRDWEKRLGPFRGTRIVTYHRNWSYFAKRFGFEVAGELEPKPGIPPTPKHLAALESLMKEKGVRLVIKESYQEGRTPKKVADEAGAKVLTLSQSVGETKEGRDYISMMEENVRKIEEALSPSPSPLPPVGGEEIGEGG